MTEFEREYEAYKKQELLKREYATYKAAQAKEQELAQGGAIKQGSSRDFANPPYGAVVGGIAGSLIGGGATGGAGAFAGGTLGAMAGEATQQLVEHAIGSPAAPETTEEAMRRIGGEGLFGMVGEGVGRLVAKPAAGRFITSPFAKTIRPEAVEATKFLQPYMPMPFLPAEMTETRVLDILENVAEYSLIGGGKIQKFKRDRQAVLQGIADEMLDTLGPKMGDDQIGRAVGDILQERERVSKIVPKMQMNMIEQTVAPGYQRQLRQMKTRKTTMPVMGEEQVEVADPGFGTKIETRIVQTGEKMTGMRVMSAEGEQQVSGVVVDLRPLKESIAGALRVAKDSGGLADREMGHTIVTFLSEKPDLVSYPVAKQIRSEVRTFRDVLAQSENKKFAPAVHKANNVYDTLTKTIRKALNDFDPFIAQQWDEANAAYAASEEVFGNQVIRRLVKLADERGGEPIQQIGEAIFQRGLTEIRHAKSAIGNERVWNAVLRGKMERMFHQSISTDGRLIGTVLENKMFGADGVGQQAMVAAFGPERVARYRQFVNALKLAQERQSEGTGRMLIQLSQAGAAGNVVMNVTGMKERSLTKESLAIILGPSILAKAMVDPDLANMLVKGFSIPAWTEEAAAIGGRLVQALFPRPDWMHDDGEKSKTVVSTGMAPIRPMELQQ